MGESGKALGLLLIVWEHPTESMILAKRSEEADLQELIAQSCQLTPLSQFLPEGVSESHISIPI